MMLVLGPLGNISEIGPQMHALRAHFLTRFGGWKLAAPARASLAAVLEEFLSVSIVDGGSYLPCRWLTNVYIPPVDSFAAPSDMQSLQATLLPPASFLRTATVYHRNCRDTTFHGLAMPAQITLLSNDLFCGFANGRVQNHALYYVFHRYLDLQSTQRNGPYTLYFGRVQSPLCWVIALEVQEQRRVKPGPPKWPKQWTLYCLYSLYFEILGHYFGLFWRSIGRQHLARTLVASLPGIGIPGRG